MRSLALVAALGLVAAAAHGRALEKDAARLVALTKDERGMEVRLRDMK